MAESNHCRLLQWLWSSRVPWGSERWLLHCSSV